MNNKSILLLILLISIPVIATEQEKEKLIYDGDTCFILETPLDLLLGQGRSEHFDIEKTSLWRGYVGIWTIKDSILYLVDIEAKKNGKVVKFSEIFDDKEELEGKWYTGRLTIIGTTVEYSYRPYDMYAPHIEMKVEDGQIKNILKIEGKDIKRELKKDSLKRYSILFGSIALGLAAIVVLVSLEHK